MKDACLKGRSKFRTALVVVAPSAIFVVGTLLVSIAALPTSEAAFEPNWILLLGGVPFVVTLALAAILSVDRPEQESNRPVQSPPDP
jgi:hypothetical protein